MMSYEEMTRSVLEKVKLRKAVRKRRNRRIAFATCGLCCALLVVGVSRYLHVSYGPAIGGETYPGAESSNTPVDSDKSDLPRLILLTAVHGGESQMPMPFNLEVPYKAEIRVHNILGLTETELQQIISEERNYIRKLADENGLDFSYSSSLRENVYITSVSLGCFAVRFEDINQVERIRAAVTENGRLHVIPRVDGCSNSAYGKMSIVDIDGESLREDATNNQNSGIQMYWHSSVETEDKIDAKPNMDISCISDAITIIVNYKDGREETATVYIRVDSKGQVSTILAEPFIVQYPVMKR